jgi:transcriptional regulator with XRE-family HTH domain
LPQKSIAGNPETAKRIKDRRIELHLTIEEAAVRAGVGTKTWSRYEAGESIRVDKCKGICKALNWLSFPDESNGENKQSLLEQYATHEAWSSYLEENYGKRAAFSFAVGSDLLLDKLKEDLSELASMPAGSHVGQLDISMLADDLPPQFLTRYDYDFLFHMKCNLLIMRQRAKSGVSLIAHSVLDELIIYLCNEEALGFIEITEAETNFEDENGYDEEDWEFDLFGDMDIVTCLYSDMYLSEDHCYHFIHWNEDQFYNDN